MEKSLPARSFFDRFAPIDFIAIITIVGGYFLLATEDVDVVSPILIAVTGFYFGVKVPKINNPL